MRGFVVFALLSCLVRPVQAEEAECALPIGVSAGQEELGSVAREADRRFRWSFQALRALRDELRSATFSDPAKSAQERRHILRGLANSSAQPWLQTKEAACACLPWRQAPPVCASLAADRADLRSLFPRRSLRRPPDIDRLIKGR